MRTYLAPLGFDSRRVVRPVLSEGLKETDKVVLLQPATESERSNDAFEEVETILTQVAPTLDIVSKSLPYTDFVETTLVCADIIQNATGETTVIVGGGAREILLPLTVATFTNANYIDTVLQVGDIDSSVRGVPRLNLQGRVSDAEADLLRELHGLDTPLCISDIADKVNKSKSTITRQVNSLEEKRFVKSSKEGRSKMIYMTDSGRVFLKGYDSART